MLSNIFYRRFNMEDRSLVGNNINMVEDILDEDLLLSDSNECSSDFCDNSPKNSDVIRMDSPICLSDYSDNIEFKNNEDKPIECGEELNNNEVKSTDYQINHCCTQENVQDKNNPADPMYKKSLEKEKIHSDTFFSVFSIISNIRMNEKSSFEISDKKVDCLMPNESLNISEKDPDIQIIEIPVEIVDLTDDCDTNNKPSDLIVVGKPSKLIVAEFLKELEKVESNLKSDLLKNISSDEVLKKQKQLTEVKGEIQFYRQQQRDQDFRNNNSIKKPRGRPKKITQIPSTSQSQSQTQYPIKEISRKNNIEFELKKMNQTPRCEISNQIRALSTSLQKQINDLSKLKQNHTPYRSRSPLKVNENKAELIRSYQTRSPIPSTSKDVVEPPETYNCPICIEPINKHNTYVIPPCGHVFCKLCLLKFTETNPQELKCPVCKSQFTSKEDIKPIFFS